MTDYKFPSLGTQYTAIYSLEHDFVDRISPARTFCFFSEIKHLKDQGLIKGGSIDNALVFLDREIDDSEINELPPVNHIPQVNTGFDIMFFKIRKKYFLIKSFEIIHEHL